MPDASVDSIVTDPPYGLSFMGKKWDYDVPGVDVWAECLRVLKPGGHLLAFAGTRTQHRMAVRIEDAGFEIRDMIAWVYGSGFPKSLDVSKAIDKAEGAEREVIGDKRRPDGKTVLSARSAIDPAGEGWDRPWRHDPARTEAQGKLTAPATDAARQWQGWGTALKPALEPITVARKPLVGTVAANVLEHGTGALNIDGCRVPAEKATGWGGGGSSLYDGGLSREGGEARLQDAGRWPANLIHDGTEPADLLGETARFFYCAKASKSDRGGENTHPTVKPTDLMRYLCRLVTPPGGVVLDPFMGSGSTGKAAVGEGFRFVGCEMSPEYMAIAKVRIQRALEQFLGDLA